MIDRTSLFAGVSDAPNSHESQDEIMTREDTELLTLREADLNLQVEAPMDSYFFWNEEDGSDIDDMDLYADDTADGISLRTEQTNATTSRRRGILIVDSTSQKELSISSVPSDIPSIQDSTNQNCQSDNSNSNSNSNNKRPWLTSLIVLSFAVTILLAAYLVYERQTFLQKNKELEQQLQQANDAMELQAKKEREQKQLILFEKKKKNDALRLAGPSQQRIILESDNCWFNVKIALGDCANDAIDCLEGIGQNLYDKVRERDQEGQLQLANLAEAALQEATTVATATAVKFVNVLWYGAKQLDVAVLNGVEYARDAIEESLREKHFKKK